MNGGAVSDVRKSSNGATMAKRVRREEAGFRMPSKNIAAIDFGTTQCSLSYITERGRPQRLRLHTSFDRVPNAVLFRSNGTLMEFGINTLTVYMKNLTDDQRLNYYYFDKIKVELQHDEGVSRETKVKAANGTEFYLVDVIAQILRHLKELLLKSLDHSGHPMQATDFDWVITVPAIWRARGKQMMREAGYKAGLCSQKKCEKLQVAGDIPPEQCEEENPDKLLLALEPESASLYCQCETPQHFQPPASYLVVDIGGGTVDICGYRILETAGSRRMEMIQQPSGGMFGGYIVNKHFEKYLENIVGDEGFSAYCNTSDSEKNAKQTAQLKWLISHTFEEQKKIFGSKKFGTSGHLRIELPSSFAKTYEKALVKGLQNDSNAEYDSDEEEIQMSYDKMREFFDPVISEIQGYINEAVTLMGDFDAIFLVGGFGGCEYVRSIVEGTFADKCLVPKDPDYAVVIGATLFGQNPNAIDARTADATYGIEMSLKFNNEIHDKEYRYRDDDGILLCDKIFKPFVAIGDYVSTGEVFVDTFGPVYHNQTQMRIDIYSSYETDIWYTTGKRGKGCKSQKRAHVYRLGRLIVDMPNTMGDKSRTVIVTFDFSRTEIQAKAYDETSYRKVKVALDFLSTTKQIAPDD